MDPNSKYQASQQKSAPLLSRARLKKMLGMTVKGPKAKPPSRAQKRARRRMQNWNMHRLEKNRLKAKAEMKSKKRRKAAVKSNRMNRSRNLSWRHN